MGATVIGSFTSTTQDLRTRAARRRTARWAGPLRDGQLAAAAAHRELLLRVGEAYEDGMSLRQIAGVMHVSYTTVKRWLEAL